MNSSEFGYRDGPLQCRGFLAYDEQSAALRPGVLLVHEAWVLGEQVKMPAKHRAGKASVLVCVGAEDPQFLTEIFGRQESPKTAARFT